MSGRAPPVLVLTVPVLAILGLCLYLRRRSRHDSEPPEPPPDEQRQPAGDPAEPAEHAAARDLDQVTAWVRDNIETVPEPAEKAPQPAAVGPAGDALRHVEEAVLQSSAKTSDAAPALQEAEKATPPPTEVRKHTGQKVESIPTPAGEDRDGTVSAEEAIPPQQQSTQEAIPPPQQRVTQESVPPPQQHITQESVPPPEQRSRQECAPPPPCERNTQEVETLPSQQSTQVTDASPQDGTQVTEALPEEHSKQETGAPPQQLGKQKTESESQLSKQETNCQQDTQETEAPACQQKKQESDEPLRLQTSTQETEAPPGQQSTQESPAVSQQATEDAAPPSGGSDEKRTDPPAADQEPVGGARPRQNSAAEPAPPAAEESEATQPAAQPAEAAADNASENSSDSGKGGSSASLEQASPSNTPESVPSIQNAVYDFLIPQKLCGRLIGKNGTFVNLLKARTGAHVIIRLHPVKTSVKICSVEGTQSEIDACLKMIREKFPLGKFPAMTLEQLNRTEEQALAVPDSQQLHLPLGITCDVLVSAVVSAGQLFLQQHTHPTFRGLERLNALMLACYGDGASTPELPRPVMASAICAAPVAGGWYRAQVVAAYPDTDQLDVRFMDYGGYSRIDAAQARQIRTDFMSLPFQAEECYLANIMPLSEEGWSMESGVVFEQLITDRALEAMVVGYAEDGTPFVNLYSIQATEYGNNAIALVNQQMVEGGAARWVENQA